MKILYSTSSRDHGTLGHFGSREDKNEQSAARSTKDAECEDVMEDSLDEIDKEGMTQPVQKLVCVYYSQTSLIRTSNIQAAPSSGQFLQARMHKIILVQYSSYGL